MSIELEVIGLKELQTSFRNIEKEGLKRVQTQVALAAIEFQRDVRKTIAKPTGRYKRYVSQKGRRTGQPRRRTGVKYHWSSNPGKPPNSDTGDLRGSIMVTKRPSMMSPYALVKAGGPGAKYAKFVEKGTRRMKARPYWWPMIKKKTPIFVRRIRQAIKGAL